ncbi:MAG: YciI family protein [Pyrinomonadaceae bacterium]
MTTESTSQTFILLLRGGESARNMSPTEYGQVVEKYMAWAEALRQSGHYKAGEPLQEEGRILSGKRGSIVTDGPFAESKEAIGGYFMITARSLDEAAEIAKGCPIFDNDGTVEVRPIAVIPGSVQ